MRADVEGLAPAVADPNDRARALFAPLPRRYDRLAELLSFGQNRRWRRAAVAAVTDGEPAPARVLDVAAGTAGVTMVLARRAAAHVVGVDLTESMLREGARRVAGAGLAPTVSLAVAGAERLPFPDATFDALTFSYLLRYVADPWSTLRELARVVRPGGRMASLEFAVPPRLFWRACWWAYTYRLLPVAGAIGGGRAWYDVGRFLGPSITAHYRRYPVEWTTSAWRAAGFVDVGYRLMSLGGGLVMWGTRGDD